MSRPKAWELIRAAALGEPDRRPFTAEDLEWMDNQLAQNAELEAELDTLREAVDVYRAEAVHWANEHTQNAALVDREVAELKAFAAPGARDLGKEPVMGLRRWLYVRRLKWAIKIVNREPLRLNMEGWQGISGWSGLTSKRSPSQAPPRRHWES
jgi:hypothetical protein